MMIDPTNSRYKFNILKNNNYRRFVQDDVVANVKLASLNKNIEDIPAHGTYGELLFHPKWKNKRKLILQRDLNSCVICRGKENLQVHHRQYHFIVRDQKFKLPWNYTDNLMITLCRSCHQKGHSKFKVPTINI